jgi:hypothetical protein
MSPEEIADEEARNKSEADSKAAAEQGRADHMIPKARLDEEIAKREALKAELVAAQKLVAESQAAETKRKEAELSEVERLKAENLRETETRKKLEESLREERIKSAIITAANMAQYGEGKHKFIDAETAYKLVSRAEIKIEGDEVKGVKEALTALANEKKFLLETPASNNGDGVGTGRRSTKTMTAAEIQKSYPKSRY